MTFEKIKTFAQMRAKYIHNYREKEVENADPDRAHLNDELVHLPEINNRQLSYQEAFQKRIHELPYYSNHNIRSNAVLGLEIVTTFSRSANDKGQIDLEEWKKQNVAWLQKTFNHAEDGKNNVLSVMYHGDEAGNVHCHAFVIPIDENGKLNASRYTDGSRMCSQMQTSYAQDMEVFGLERGLEHSHAKHKDIKKYYAELNKAMDVPSPYEGETAREYKDRIIEELRTARAATKRKCDEEERKHTERLTKLYSQEHYAVEKELHTATLDIEKCISQLSKQESSLQRNVTALARQETMLQESIKKISEQYGDPESVHKKIEFYDTFQKQYQFLRKEHPEEAEKLWNSMNEMSQFYESKIEELEKY